MNNILRGAQSPGGHSVSANGYAQRTSHLQQHDPYEGTRLAPGISSYDPPIQSDLFAIGLQMPDQTQQRPTPPHRNEYAQGEQQHHQYDNNTRGSPTSSREFHATYSDLAQQANTGLYTEPSMAQRDPVSANRSPGHPMAQQPFHRHRHSTISARLPSETTQSFIIHNDGYALEVEYAGQLGPNGDGAAYPLPESNDAPWSPYRMMWGPQDNVTIQIEPGDSSSGNNSLGRQNTEVFSGGSRIATLGSDPNDADRVGLPDSLRGTGYINGLPQQTGDVYFHDLTHNQAPELGNQSLDDLRQVAQNPLSGTAMARSSGSTVRCTINGCGAQFIGQYRTGNRARHIREIHGGRRYFCEEPGCEKRFHRSDSRLKHYRKRHPHRATIALPRRR